MKKGTDALAKFLLMKKDLKLPKFAAKGLLQDIWDFTALNTPEGNLGKYTNEEIAMFLEYEGDPDELIAVLLRRRWLDADDEHRLLVHDWPDHCEDGIHIRLAKERRRFSDGSMPKLTKFTEDKRVAIERDYQHTRAGRNGTTTKAPPAQTAAPPTQVPSAQKRSKAQASAIAREKAPTMAPAEPSQADTEPRRTETEPAPEAPSSVGSANFEPSGPDFGVDYRAALWKRLKRVVLRRAGDPEDGRDPPWYEGWWKANSRRVVDLGGIQALEDAVKDVEDRGDPKVRAAKDLGPLTAPARYVAGRLQGYLKLQGESLTAPPKPPG